MYAFPRIFIPAKAVEAAQVWGPAGLVLSLGSLKTVGSWLPALGSRDNYPRSSEIWGPLNQMLFTV
jgi:hypothetical protein